jgi:hypothetical protein
LATLFCGWLVAGASAGGAHRDPCHSAHTCPSDHHTYDWHGLSCTSYEDERTAADTKVVVVGGRTYWCHTETGGAQPTAPTSPTPAVPSSGAAMRSIPTTLAHLELARLRVRPEATMLGYSRARFGEPWEDVDGNGCDTRDDILRRDLTHVVFKPGSRCTVESGVLHDPYTGRTIRFRRGVSTSLTVQIDHVVALADAWRTGANSWPFRKRLRYANDPVVLLAVDGPSNGAKSDDDASEWLPPDRGYDCIYAKKQISIKTKYGLWVEGAEKRALQRALEFCR